MCGRFSLTTTRIDLARELALPLDAIPAGLAPRWNIAPTQQVVVLRDQDGLRLDLLQWGLVPEWAKDPSIGNRLINARAETLADRPSFKVSFRRHRCLVVADGFYEWVTTKNGKRPYFIHFLDGRTFAFAGLWERWTARGGASLESCTIITTAANDLIADLHHRMPVILPPERHGEWLQPESLTVGRLNELLVPHPAGEMAAYQVSTHVNRPGNDDAECIARVEG